MNFYHPTQHSAINILCTLYDYVASVVHAILEGKVSGFNISAPNLPL